jgi:hypothetical protein
MLKEFRPIYFFGGIAVLLACGSIILGYPLFITFIKTGLVPRFPTAILATGLMILAFLGLTCALILDSVCTGRLEAKRVAYLAIPWNVTSHFADPVLHDRAAYRDTRGGRPHLI